MEWLWRLSERLLGYVPAGGWRLYPLDALHRRRFSLPQRVPVPADVWRRWRRGQRPERLSHAELAEYASRFLRDHGQHPLAPSLSCFAAKAPLARRIEETLRRSSWSEAVPLLEQVIAQDPADGRAHFLLALAFLGQDQPTAAAQHLAQADPQMEVDADYQVTRGRLAERRGDLATAREAYQRALALQEGHAAALERLAALGDLVEIYLGDLESPEKAYLTREDYEEVIAKDWDAETRTAAFFLDRSRFHLLNAQAEVALRAGRRGAEIARVGAEEAACLEAQGRALLALEKQGEAADVLRRLMVVAPGSAAALSLQGQLLWFEGRTEEAAAVIREAIDADPGRLENLRLYLDPRFPREIRDPLHAVDQLLQKYPQSPAVQSIAASLFMAAGDWKRGIEAAFAAASYGASEEALIEMSGRLGRAGRFAEVAQLTERAGGWQRFVEAHPLLRANLAAALGRSAEGRAAQKLWQSLLNDRSVHPELRARAREALRAASGACDRAQLR